jgi:hypothetical protein
MAMHPFYRFLDPFLIWFYRLTGSAPVDFIIGTLVLALLAVIIGEYAISLVFLAGRKNLDRLNQEAVRYRDLTLDALKAGDKPAYQAANKMANEAFGKVFFLQIALSAARLWPVPLALAWMQYRFKELEFPLGVVPYSLGFVGVFLLLYVLAYFLFKQFKYRLPYLSRIKEILDAYDPPGARRAHPGRWGAAPKLDGKSSG